MKKKMPIHYTIENHSREMLDILLQYGSNIDAKDINYHKIVLL